MNFFEKIKSIFIKKRQLEKSEIKHAYSGINVKFSAETEKKRLQNEEKLYALIKENINTPENLLKSAVKDGVKIYVLKNCDKILKTVNEEEGFIFPQTGIKALKLNIILSSGQNNAFNFSFKTPPMFIFEKDSVEIYTITYALHKYFSFKSKMPGCDEKSQKLFNKASKEKNKNTISRMNIKDVTLCKEATARDLEAINFALRISKEFAGVKNALNKLKSDNSAIL